MATITPTLTITANAASATSNPGPSSSAISLSVTDALTVDVLKAATVTPSVTHSILFDGSTEDVGSGVAGTNGAFIYFKNTSAADHDVYIGIASAALEGDGSVNRLFTLKQDEFAFLPYDYTLDLYVDAENAAATLEYMLFNRA